MYTVVFTTCAQDVPAAVRIAPRFWSTRSVWAATSPSMTVPVAGSSAIWPAVNRSPAPWATTAWEYGPIAAGACGVWIDCMEVVMVLEESHDLAVRTDCHPLGRRLLGESRHRHDVAGLRDHETRASRGIHLVDRDPEPGRPSEPGRVVGQGILRLGHAHRRVAEPDRFQVVDRPVGLAGEVGALAAVHAAHDGVDLLANRERGRVQRPVPCRPAVEHLEHGAASSMPPAP